MPEAMAHGIHPKHSVPRTEVDICMFTLLCRIVIIMVYLNNRGKITDFLEDQQISLEKSGQHSLQITRRFLQTILSLILAKLHL